MIADALRRMTLSAPGQDRRRSRLVRATLAAAALAAACAFHGCGGNRAPAAPPVAPGPVQVALERPGSAEAASFRGEAGRAQFEKACGLMRGGEPAAAIVEFNRLIPLEPVEIPDGELPDYDSLDHMACLAISECFEKTGDLGRALEFALLARDAHKFYAPAGSTVKAHEMMLAERIARLKAALGRGTRDAAPYAGE